MECLEKVLGRLIEDLLGLVVQGGFLDECRGDVAPSHFIRVLNGTGLSEAGNIG